MLMGTGAILKQGSSSKPLTIGKGAIIGMGSVVTKDVPAFTTVIGKPARPIKKNKIFDMDIKKFIKNIVGINHTQNLCAT